MVPSQPGSVGVLGFSELGVVALHFPLCAVLFPVSLLPVVLVVLVFLVSDFLLLVAPVPGFRGIPRPVLGQGCYL